MNRIINTENALYLEAAESYCILILNDGKYSLKSRPMKFFAPKLQSSGWFQIHRKYIVNPDFVDHITEDRENICLQNGKLLPISRRKQREVLKWRNN